MIRKAHKVVLSVALVAAAANGCGTVVGNPKKPTGTQTTSAINYELPSVSLTVPTEATTGGSASLLDGVGAGDGTLLSAWGTRLSRMLKNIDLLSAAVTRVAKAERAADPADDTLVFHGRGADGKMSGKLQPLTDGGDYAYEAVICQDGQLVTDFRWSSDGKKIDLVRDFSHDVDGQADPFSLVSHVTVTLGDDVTLDAVNQSDSVANELPQQPGVGLSEASHTVRHASGELDIRLVADRYAPADRPEDGRFSGDTYLVGRLVPKATGPQGNPVAFDTQFVGYYVGYRILCAAGFDEGASDLWHPTFTGPRFCEGRPGTGQKFLGRQQFYDTLTALKPIGVQPKASLVRVGFPAGVTCP